MIRGPWKYGLALLLCGVLAGAAVFIWRVPDAFGRKPGKLNVILITIDALRADHMGIYGYSRDTSPNIDTFARNAIVFKNAFCAVPKTTGSVTTLMTGQHPFIHGVSPSNDRVPGKLTTLAEIFKTNGYHTAGIVDNASVGIHFGFARGFDEYTEVWRETRQKAESTEFITGSTIRFVEESHSKPFFLWVHYVETHTPLVTPKEYVRYDPSTQGRNMRDIPRSWIRTHAYALSVMRSDTPYEGYLVALYDAAIRYVDDAVGKVLAAIDKQHLDDTVVIIAADHGEELGEHNLFLDHGMLTFPASTQVPLVIRFPGESPRFVSDPVSLMDVYPTLVAEVLGRQPQGPGSTVSLLGPIPARDLYIHGSESHAIVNGSRYYTQLDKPDLAENLGIAQRYYYDLSDGIEREVDQESVQREFEQADARYREFYRRNPYPRRKNLPDEDPTMPAEDRENLKTLGYIE